MVFPTTKRCSPGHLHNIYLTRTWPFHTRQLLSNSQEVDGGAQKAVRARSDEKTLTYSIVFPLDQSLPKITVSRWATNEKSENKTSRFFTVLNLWQTEMCSNQFCFLARGRKKKQKTKTKPDKFRETFMDSYIEPFIGCKLGYWLAWRVSWIRICMRAVVWILGLIVWINTATLGRRQIPIGNKPQSLISASGTEGKPAQYLRSKWPVKYAGLTYLHGLHLLVDYTDNS